MERPAHLSEENAARFEAESVADAYRFRLPYPDEVFEVLLSLIVDEPRVVLDLGTGTGELARRIAPLVERVDAVDVSAAMVERGRRSPGGEAPNLNWIVGRAEDAPLSPPYSLITAGESLHWMDWDVLLPRLARALTLGGNLAMVYRNELPPPWQSVLMELVQEASAMRNYEEYDLAEILASRGLFEMRGRATARAERVEQPVEEYVQSFFSRASLSAEAIGPERASRFAERLRALVQPWASAGNLGLESAGIIVWGRPMEGSQ
jgi:SAM-dependent methyltransferase